MNYLESKVKELFEQVLRGEKRVPKLETRNELNWDSVVTYHSMLFGDRLTVEYVEYYNETRLLVSMRDEEGRTEVVYLFEDEDRDEFIVGKDTTYKTKLRDEKIEIERLFKGVWNYTKRVEEGNKLMWVDRIFGELE